MDEHNKALEWGQPLRYSCDDHGKRRNDLIIQQGGNGDWYVAVDHEGAMGIGHAVRLCTSGGASSKCPGLTVAIAQAYRALFVAAGGKLPGAESLRHALGEDGHG